MWLKASNIDCKHGFSTRHGGVSPAPFNSLNLGGSQDSPENIAANRNLALGLLNLQPSDLSMLRQVHGVHVCTAVHGFQEGDALVTNSKNHILAVSAADCYPILFHDSFNQVIGAAHAGWRGTVQSIAARVIDEMQKLGAEAAKIQVAIGPGISLEKFEVGSEVIEIFRANGFPEYCWQENRVDLIQCNLHVLKQNNILEKNITVLNRCTFENDFFSHRRDKGITGRMWGLITLQ